MVSASAQSQRIPDDLMLVGQTEDDAIGAWDVPLSNVTMLGRQSGRIAAETLIAAIDGSVEPVVHMPHRFTCAGFGAVPSAATYLDHQLSTHHDAYSTHSYPVRTMFGIDTKIRPRFATSSGKTISARSAGKVPQIDHPLTKETP